MIHPYEIRDLIDKLNSYTKTYDEGHPQISDKEWDDLYFQLEKMEKESKIIYPDSPTQHISFKVVSALPKSMHNHPMLSLDKTKDVKAVSAFVSGQDWFGMFKMDGLSCSLTYYDGKLFSAETRGNGEVGEIITHNIPFVKGIPIEIPALGQVTVDGEIICTYSDFKKHENEYKNPRNYAAGSIRLLDSEECAFRDLTFVAWDLINGSDEDFNFWRLEKLDDWGFITVPRVGDAETIEDAIAILDDMKNGEDAYKDSEYQDYPIDGYVFKFESRKYGESLGQTDHHFKNAIAFKFYDDLYDTRLRHIDWTMGRTGVLTPVAVFDPVEIDGTIVERANLHNYSIMREALGNCAYVGEPLRIFKANQIIPQVYDAGPKYDYGYVIAHAGVSAGDEIEMCPCCRGEVSLQRSAEGVQNLICINPNCEGKLQNRIDHYCSKKGLDIKGISKATIEKLIDWGWVACIKDIYNLHAHQMEWMEQDGFGKASVFKILDAIDDSRQEVSLSSFIAALGIPLIGKTVAKSIVQYYNTWEDFRAAVGGDWTQFNGFGYEMSKALNSFDYTEADEIVKLLSFSNISKKENKKVENLTFVITGKLSRKREDIKIDIETNGGRVANAVSSKTNYLVCNNKNSTTGKSADAKRLGIQVITEEELLELLK